MACHSPIQIITQANDSSKNKAVQVPCGRCLGCLSAKRAAWTFRIMQEERHSIAADFVTLTYNEEHIPKVDGFKTLSKPHLQKYIKRIRKAGVKNLKYYAVGEYGEKYQRPHYHLLLFNVPIEKKELIIDKWSQDGEQMGNVQIDKVSQASIHYCTKYITGNQDWRWQGMPKHTKPFSIMSKKLGIGYVETSKDHHKKTMSSTVVYPGGHKQVMPRYYREKIFTETENAIIGEQNRLTALDKMADQVYDEIIQNRVTQRIKAERSKKSNFL